MTHVRPLSPPDWMIRFDWASVFQSELLERLRVEKIELQLGQRLRRERLDTFLDVGRQRAELRFQEPQGRPTLPLLNAALDAGFDAAFISGFHERFDLLIDLCVQKRLQPLLLGLNQLCLRLKAFGQEELSKVIFSRSGDPFQLQRSLETPVMIVTAGLRHDGQLRLAILRQRIRRVRTGTGGAQTAGPRWPRTAAPSPAAFEIGRTFPAWSSSVTRVFEFRISCFEFNPRI